MIMLAGADFEGEIDYGLIGHLKGDAPLGFRFEPRMFALDFVVANGKFRGPIGTIVSG